MVGTVQNAPYFDVSSHGVGSPSNRQQAISLPLSFDVAKKNRSPGLGLVQRAITVALYGNGAHKAVSHYY